MYGATDPYLISTGYYYYSTNIVAKTAKILGKEEDADYYGTLAAEIYEAFVREYSSPAGRLCVDEKEPISSEYRFVGTPYLCRVLSENGMNDLAYHLLLEKGYPGWLYQVTMGATTVWELKTT